MHSALWTALVWATTLRNLIIICFFLLRGLWLFLFRIIYINSWLSFHFYLGLHFIRIRLWNFQIFKPLTLFIKGITTVSFRTSSNASLSYVFWELSPYTFLTEYMFALGHYHFLFFFCLLNWFLTKVTFFVHKLSKSHHSLYFLKYFVLIWCGTVSLDILVYNILLILFIFAFFHISFFFNVFNACLIMINWPHLMIILRIRSILFYHIAWGWWIENIHFYLSI